MVPLNAFKLPVACCPFYGGDSVVVDLLFIAVPIVYGVSVLGPCCVIQCMCRSSFAIILMGKGESVALL